MPEDVPLGAGYVGDALFTRFPGQYRDPEMDSQQRAHFNSFPGNHGPVYTDPDNGRKLVAKDMPGIGLVMVPADAERNMGSVVPVEHSMAAVYPSDHTMVGVDGLDGDEPGTDLGRLHWHNKLVLALDQTASIPDSSKQLMVAFNDIAQQAVKRAMEKASKCRFSSVEDAVEFVRAAIVASAKNFKGPVVKLAIQVAESASRAAAPAIKKVFCAWKPGVRRAVGKFRRQSPKAQRQPALEDWPGSMMGVGGISESITNAVAGGELDQLARSISKLADALISAYDQVSSLREQESLAQDRIGASDGRGEMYVQALSAKKSVLEGYRSLTGFDYMTQVLANVFSPNAQRLDRVYSGVTGILGQIRNWNDTWQRQIGDTHPEMVQLWDAIQNEHNRLWAAMKKGPFSFDDPAYLTTASQAVQNVTGVRPEAADGLGDFGITALIGVIVVSLAAVAVAIAVVKLAKEFNVVANNIAKQRSEYEASKEREREQYIAARTAEGATYQQATEEWLKLKADYDRQQAQKEAEYAKNAPQAGDLGKYIGYGVAAVGVAVALPHILKIFGL